MDRQADLTRARAHAASNVVPFQPVADDALAPTTPAETIVRGAYDALRAADRREGGLDIAARGRLLRALREAVRDGKDEIVSAIDTDFGGRPAQETLLAEVSLVLGSIDHALKHLHRWARPKSVRLGMEFWPAKGRVERVPLGVVGILSPWNYPVQLALVPLVAALSAGNRVLLRPSEFTPRTAALLERIVTAALPPDVARVVTGDADVARAVTALPLDHLFYTGSTATGRHVMRAAADNLTPVTLELGGKSPAILLDDIALDKAAASIMAGKLLSAGQTCIAPDYLLVPRHQMDGVIDALRTAARTLYPDPDADDYAAIARPEDRVRLLKLLEGEDAIPLFDAAPKPPKLGAYVLRSPSPRSPAMTDEIFGPILPLVPYDALDDAIAFVNDRPHPLALYVYGRDEAVCERVVARTRSGGASINEAVLHVAAHELPFGGVGASGMGAYHGAAGFETFSHARSVFRQGRFDFTRFARPPYGAFANRLIGYLTR